MHSTLLHESLEIMRCKNHDYSGASGDPLSNFRLSTKIGIDVGDGIALRIMDKHQRIRTFIKKGMLSVKTESVKDAILDCINYTFLLNAYQKGVTLADDLYRTRSELEAWLEGSFAAMPEDPMILLNLLEDNMCSDSSTNCAYLLHGYLTLGEVLI